MFRLRGRSVSATVLAVAKKKKKNQPTSRLIRLKHAKQNQAKIFFPRSTRVHNSPTFLPRMGRTVHAATKCRIMTRERAAWERRRLAARTFSPLALREPEKMPRRVTAIQSDGPLTTLTKPFSAGCALPKVPRRFARPTRMPPLHALDTQALARPSGGGAGRRRIVKERSGSGGGGKKRNKTTSSS